MEDWKYVNSHYRIVICRYRVKNGVKDEYTTIDFHFRKEEIEGEKSDFILAFGATMKVAIDKIGLTTVEQYNKEGCIKDRYLRMHLEDGLGAERTEGLLLKACKFIENTSFDTTKNGKIYDLIFKYEREIRACANAIRESILTDTDCARTYQYIIFRISKGRNNGRYENN